MADEFCIATAYVQFTTKDGDKVESDIDKQQGEADRATRQHIQKQRQMLREQREAEAQRRRPGGTTMTSPRQQMQQARIDQPEGSGTPSPRQKAQQDRSDQGGSAGMRDFERRFGGDSYSRFQRQRQSHTDRMAGSEKRVDRDHTNEQKRADRLREQREKEASRENEKTMRRMTTMRRRMAGQVEGFHKQEEKVETDIHNDRRMRMLKAGALASAAGGSLPFVGAAGHIAMAGAMGGPAAAAGMAAGKVLNYGMEGAGKHSPATMERFQYQQDRLQGAVGSAFVPAIEKMTQGFEWLGNKMGGKGYELAAPKMGGFDEMRDRLQMEALRSVPEPDRNAPGQRAMRALSAGGPILGPGMAIGSAISKDFSEAVDKFDKAIEGNFAGRAAKAAVNPEYAAELIGRNIMSVFS